MVANSYLEIYTLIFGWQMYGAIWDVLAGSGIVLIPIIGAVISNFIENYESGDAKSAIRGLEMKMLGMVLVLMLCVIPFRGFNLTLASVEYNFNVPDCGLTVNPGNVVSPGDPLPPPDPSAVGGTGTNTGTAYDTNTMATAIGGLNVYKPIAWSFVEFLSSAITHSTIKSMGCVNNYELMLMRVGQIEIIDPVLRDRVRAFTEHCYNVAKVRFDTNPVNIPTNVSQWDDIDWIGSRIFIGVPAQAEYYRHETAYMSNGVEMGFTRMPAGRASDAAKESGAYPYCNEVWMGERAPGQAPGLRQLLLEHIQDDLDDANGDILDDWNDWGSQVLTVGNIAQEFREDLLLKMVLQGNAANLSSATDISLTNDFEATDASGGGFLDTLFAYGGILNSVDQFLQANVMKQMVKIVGPMILALVQMVIIMSAIFVMVMGKYKLEAFVSIALAYFAFEFINAIWAAAFWFDQQILDIYLSQSGWLDVKTNKFIVMSVSAGATILLPSVWLSIIAYAGAGMVRGMGMAGVGGGQAAGSAVGGGAHRAGAKGAAKGAGMVGGKVRSAYQNRGK